MSEQEHNLSEALKMTSEEVSELALIGKYYYEQGNLDKAKKIFESLINIDDTNVQFHSALGAIYTRSGDEENAINCLNKALEIEPNNFASLANKIEVLVEKKSLEEAVIELKKITELDKNIKNPSVNRARVILLGIFDAMRLNGLIKKES